MVLKRSRSMNMNANPVWWRAERGAPLRTMTDGDRADLQARFEARGRLDQLERV